MRQRASVGRRLLWRLEAAALDLVFALCRAIGPVRASNLGGAVGRWIGPWLPPSTVARRNLALVFPDRSAAERRAILRAAWDNLGRTACELPHLGSLGPSEAGPGWEIVGAEHLAGLADSGPALLVSAHLANWEVLPSALLSLGIPLASIYRPPDNPVVGRRLRRWRRMATRGVVLPMFPKGAAGARSALRHLVSGGVLGLLADQKLNDGLAVPFMGHLAMTPAAPAQMALRFGCPLIPGRVERLGPARFRIRVEAPLPMPGTGDRGRDLRDLTLAVNGRIGAWIAERPGEWLWFHRRWPKAARPHTLPSRELYRLDG